MFMVDKGMKVWLLASALLCGSVASAQTVTLRVDPEQSHVAFTLDAVLHTVHGTFQVSGGDVTLDPKSAEMSGEISVEAGSGRSGNETRDRKMSNEVLEVAKFAVVSFRPQRVGGAVAASGDSTVEVSGVFAVHGVSRPLTVPVTLHIENGRYIAKAHFVVPYVQWGMKDPSTFALRVGKEVSIDLTLVGRVAGNK